MPIAILCLFSAWLLSEASKAFTTKLAWICECPEMTDTLREVTFVILFKQMLRLNTHMMYLRKDQHLLLLHFLFRVEASEVVTKQLAIGFVAFVAFTFTQMAVRVRSVPVTSEVPGSISGLAHSSCDREGNSH
jgi:hypothetical protein